MALGPNSLDLESSSSQYLTAADSASLSPTGAMTFECWIKWESVASSGNRVFVMNKDDGQPQRSYAFGFLNNAGQYTMEILISTDGQNANTNQARVNIATPSTGVWYHYGWVYTTASSGTLEAFINGVSQGTTTGMGGSVYNSTADVELAAKKEAANPASNFLDGRMVLARFWSTNRSGAQLSANQCTVLGSTTNLEAEWTLDNVYTDNTGNGNTLTPVASPAFVADIPATCVASGPTNVKTWDGITQSTGVKQYFGVDLANVKTVNGVS
jgi:hypothetical protein